MGIPARCLIVVLLACLSCGCANPPSGRTGIRDPAGASLADCERNGGTRMTVGMLGKEVCALPYADAGKACRDDADCTGICKTQASAADGAPAAGQCQRHDHDRFGCYAEVNDGKAGATLCVD